MAAIVEYLEIFWAFFSTNLLCFGGGSASIPLIQHEVVEVYGWMSELEFIEMLAAANALPGPIATKMSGYVGYLNQGILGTAIALVATVGPSLFLKISLMNFLLKHQDSPRAKRLALYIKPTIVVLLGIIVVQNFTIAANTMGIVHLLILVFAAYYLLGKRKMHPAVVILGALVYGGIVGALAL